MATTANAAPDLPELLTAAQVARLLGCSQSTVAEALKNGEFPVAAMVIGKRHLVPRRALLGYLEGDRGEGSAYGSLRTEITELREEVRQLRAALVALLAAGTRALTPPDAEDMPPRAATYSRGPR